MEAVFYVAELRMHVFQAVVCRADQAQDTLLSAPSSESGGDSSELCLGKREGKKEGLAMKTAVLQTSRLPISPL